jgi:hypothetical protein
VSHAWLSNFRRNAEAYHRNAQRRHLIPPLEDPLQFADAGLGFRAWGLSSRVALNPGLLPGVSVNPGGGWADPLIGARYHRDPGSTTG